MVILKLGIIYKQPVVYKSGIICNEPVSCRSCTCTNKNCIHVIVSRKLSGFTIHFFYTPRPSEQESRIPNKVFIGIVRVVLPRTRILGSSQPKIFIRSSRSHCVCWCSRAPGSVFERELFVWCSRAPGFRLADSHLSSCELFV